MAQRIAALRNLFHQIDRVFRPNDRHDASRRDVNSTKKLLNGDAAFTVVKTVLGWLVNSVALHLSITPSRLRRITELINEVGSKRRATSKTWFQLLGTLRSLGPSVPGGRGLLSILQKLTPRPSCRVRISCGATVTLCL